MTYTDEIETTATEIVDRFDALNADVSINPEDVVAEIRTHYEQHSMSVEAAGKHVADMLRHKYGINDQQYQNAGSQADYILVDDIDTEDQWVTVRITIDQLWEPTSSKIAQVGLASDDSGTIKFTCFDHSKDDLVEGETYLVRSGVTSLFNGNYEVIINSSSTIEHINPGADAIDVSQPIESEKTRTTDIPTGVTFEAADPTEATETTTITGNVTDISDDSGMVEECSVAGCGQLNDGACDIHGAIPEEDRFLALHGEITIENDDGTHTVTLPQDMVAEITGESRMEASNITEQSPADNPIRDKLVCELLCNWVEVKVEDSTATVEDITINPEVDETVVKAVATQHLN